MYKPNLPSSTHIYIYILLLRQSHVYGIDVYACKDVFHLFRAVYICMCSFSIVNLPVAIFDAIFVVCDPPPTMGRKFQATDAMEIPNNRRHGNPNVGDPPPSLLTSIIWDFQPLTHHLGFPATDPQEMGFPKWVT